MENTVTLPWWVFILLLLFAMVMMLDHVLLPGMRWYVRRRVNRVINEINTRLDIEIRPFQLTRKQALIDQLVFDDKVIAAIKDYAQERNMPIEVAQAKALKYANEIAPTFNAPVQRGRNQRADIRENLIRRLERTGEQPQHGIEHQQTEKPDPHVIDDRAD